MAKIETETQYEAIMARIDELLTIVGEDTPSDSKEAIELTLLSKMIEEYEDVHYPIQTPSLVAVLKLRMFELGLSQCALAAMLKISQSKISEILSGKAEPTLKQARSLVKELGIPPSVILGV